MSTNVRVRFKMRTPMIVPSVDKPLDALLSWAAVEQSEFKDVESPFDQQHDIGIAKHIVEDQWCFMASNVVYEWLGDQEVLHYIKHQRLRDYSEAWMNGLLKRAPYFHSASGITKAGNYLQPMRWASSVTAYAVVADMDRFTELLPWVTHIGKLHRTDKGAVKSYEVVQDDDAANLWRYRNLPVHSSACDGHYLGVGSLTSPYWNRKNHTDIAISPR